MDDYLPLTEQLDILFEVRLHPDGRPYTLHEVSQATGISHGTVSHMRTGRVDNPQFSTLRALCRFFDIPLRYFETKTRDACYDMLASLPEAPTPHMNEISFRAMQLSPDAQAEILRLIRWAHAAEELRKQGRDVPPLPPLEDVDGDER